MFLPDVQFGKWNGPTFLFKTGAEFCGSVLQSHQQSPNLQAAQQGLLNASGCISGPGYVLYLFMRY